jgi:hypothetical protein
VYTPWFARASESAPHRLYSYTGVQIVLACEVVEPRDPQWVQNLHLFSTCPRLKLQCLSSICLKFEPKSSS